MAGSPDSEGRPDPGATGTPAEFVDALRRLKNWAGVGYRTLVKRAKAAGHVLPRSTITAALSRDTLPRQELMVALVHACGGDRSEVDRWTAAWRRIAAGTPPPPSAKDPVAVGLMPGPVRCTLPADQVMFVGRDKEIEQIAAAAADAAEQGGMIAIHAIGGMPGIGKTTLAVHMAHKLKDRFTDRQLFVDLHAYTPGQAPAQPGDALAHLLAADGIDPRFLPDTVDGRASLWRDRMAGKRLLLVLDNASSTEQVLRLLPGSTGSLVLVTSRRSLADLPAAVPIPLDVLAPDEAITMFVRLAPRASSDRGAVAELVRACGYLPLAISITASVYLRHRSWTVEDVVREVHQSGGALTLAAENRTVAAVFDLSYQHLPADRQRLFRLLGLHPGVEIEPYATAALADLTLPEAQHHLDRLHADHLLEEPAHRRYRMHDLIRAHAHALASTADREQVREAAVRRLLDFYRHTSATAMDVTHTHERQRRPGIPAAVSPVPDLPDRTRADRWLNTELANLLAAAHYAAAQGWAEPTWHLSAVLDRHLSVQGRYRDAETLHRQALDLARDRRDHPAEMAALNRLGNIHRRQGRHDQAAEHHQRARKLAQAGGDCLGEMDALIGLGHVDWRLGRYERAADNYKRAMQIAQATGDPGGELSALMGLGDIGVMLDRYEEAAGHFERVLRVARTAGASSSELNALHGLGYVYRKLGRFEQAADHFDQALQIAEATGDRTGQLRTLDGLGLIQLVRGDFDGAADHFERALRIAEATGDGIGLLHPLHGLGHVHRMRGHHEQATECYERVLHLAGELGSGNWQFEALQGLGRLSHATGHPDLALARHQQALRYATELAQPADQASAHDGIAHAHHALRNDAQARQHWQHALDILTSLGTDQTEDFEATVPNIRGHLAGLRPRSATRDQAADHGPGSNDYDQPEMDQ